MHTRRTYAADFLFIHQQADTGPGRIFNGKHGFCGWIGANSVILSIPDDHAGIQSVVSGRPRRDSFQFSRLEISFFHIIFFLQDLKDIGFDRLRFLTFQRDASDENIEIFSLYYTSTFFIHLLCSQKDQQIRNTNNRLVVFFSNADIDGSSIFFDDNTVKRHRSCHPLILLHATVVMCLQQCQRIALVQRILL